VANACTLMAQYCVDAHEPDAIGVLRGRIAESRGALILVRFFGVMDTKIGTADDFSPSTNAGSRKAVNFQFKNNELDGMESRLHGRVD